MRDSDRFLRASALDDARACQVPSSQNESVSWRSRSHSRLSMKVMFKHTGRSAFLFSWSSTLGLSPPPVSCEELNVYILQMSILKW